jgi:hypothetical protein
MRVNLADFGQVVHFEAGGGSQLSAEPLKRGEDGWTAQQLPDGRYAIGLEWDRPRVIRECSIEFRHAIANRHLVTVEYWHKDGWRRTSYEWWAGDRDVNFRFGPSPLDEPSASSPSRCIRTRRLRFLCGPDSRPPVRYLRTYGFDGAIEMDLDIKRLEDSPFTPPLRVSTTNGYLIQSGDSLETETQLVKPPFRVMIRCTPVAADHPNATMVRLRGIRDDRQKVEFVAVDLIDASVLRLTEAGMVITQLRQQGELIPPRESAVKKRADPGRVASGPAPATTKPCE